MATVDEILRISKEQGCTCMFTEEQLKEKSQEELDIIYAGIVALHGRKLRRS